MSDLTIIENNMYIKEAFGNFNILNDLDPLYHPEIYHFAKIVSNYLKMQRIKEK